MNAKEITKGILAAVGIITGIELLAGGVMYGVASYKVKKTAKKIEQEMAELEKNGK